jgi:hypothetical protein
MRYRMLFAAVALGLALTVSAGDVAIKDPYADLSKIIHKRVLKQVPREHEEKFDWGKSIPIPDNLIAPGLPRRFVKVGDKKELAHGNWKRVHVKLDDPDKNLKIKVKEFKKMDKGGYRLLLDAEVLVRCDGEMNQYLRGLLLLRVTGQADATITSTMTCDVDIKINLKKFPPEVNVEPKIVDMTLDLKEFNLKQLGGTVQGEKIRQLGNDLMPDLIRGLLKVSEPLVKDYANEAIAASLKESKRKELLKVAPKEIKGNGK